MQKSYSDRHPEGDRDAYPKIDRDIERQLALVRYRSLKFLKKSELTLDDELFIDNFEAAMRLWWNVRLPSIKATEN